MRVCQTFISNRVVVSMTKTEAEAIKRFLNLALALYSKRGIHRPFIENVSRKISDAINELPNKGGD